MPIQTSGPMQAVTIRTVKEAEAYGRMMCELDMKARMAGLGKTPAEKAVDAKEREIPITITDRDGNTVTLSYGDYLDLTERVAEQIYKRRGAELCFTDIAAAGTAASSFDRADHADVPGTFRPEGPAPEPRPADRVSPPVQDAARPGRPAGGTKEDRRHAPGRPGTKKEGPGRLRVPGEKLQHEKTGGQKVPEQAEHIPPARGSDAAERPAGRAQGARGRKQRVQRAVVVTERGISPAPVPKKTEKPNLGTVLKKANDEKRLGDSAQKIVARAAFIAGETGREAVFADRNGNRLVFRRETDPETGQKEPKAYINGREVETAAEAESFMKGVLGELPDRIARNVENLVVSVSNNPEVNQAALERQARQFNKEVPERPLGR